MFKVTNFNYYLRSCVIDLCSFQFKMVMLIIYNVFNCYEIHVLFYRVTFLSSNYNFNHILSFCKRHTLILTYLNVKADPKSPHK